MEIGNGTQVNKKNSIDYLLKQVYSVHRNRVKELENQLKETKEELERLKETYETQLNTKNELIERLQSELKLKRTKEEKRDRDETEDGFIVCGLEKPPKRKRNEISSDNLRNNNTKELNKKHSHFERISNLILQHEQQDDDESNSDWETAGNNGDTNQIHRILVPDTIDDKEYDVQTTKNDKKTEIDRQNVIIVPETVDDCTTEIRTNRRNAEYYLENDQSKVVNRSFDDFIVPNGRLGRCNDEQRSTKKPKNQTVVQSGSKYPLYFDKPTKGYRKPKYKQMTLTQNVYVGPTTTEDEDVKRAIRESSETYESTKLVNESIRQNLSSPIGDEDSLDCTYVPSQFFRKNSIEIPKANTPKTVANDDVVEILVEDDDDNDSDLSEDLLSEIGMKSPELKGNPSKERIRNGNVLLDEDNDDFDVVPSKKQSLNYKFKRETIRKQEDRRKLEGHECRDCEAYFKEMGLTDEEKKIRLKACSRHRDKYVTSNTPEHFWSIHFPTTQQCKERGVLDTTQDEPLRGRRQRFKL